MANANVCWVGGDTGVGKSTRTPRCLLELKKEGVVHVLPKKLPAYTLKEHYQKADDRAVRALPTKDKQD